MLEAVAIIAVVALAGVTAALAWLLSRAVTDQGRRLLRDDEVREKLAQLEQALDYLAGELDHLAPLGQAPDGAGTLPTEPQQGLPLGTDAPDFHLPLLGGGQRRLSDYRGRNVLVASFDTDCGFCVALAPALGTLAPGAPVVLLARGATDRLRELADEHGWRCDVALDGTGGVARAYEAGATPTGYLVDAEGRIATPIALGGQALLALVEGAGLDGSGSGSRPPGDVAPSDGARAGAATLRTRDIAESRLQRDGLPAGTPAPDFDLPDLQGRRHTLAELRGREVLLVFSDPGCRPCQTLAPKLEHVHRDRDLVVVVISRGDPEANRSKVAEQGLTFPVLLQQHWEVSRAYAMFATPVGYRIDPEGVIAAGVAVGADAILALV